MRLPVYDDVPFMVESSSGVLLLAGFSPAESKPDACDVWLGEKVKSRILLFGAADPLSVFALLSEPLGRPIGFNFLFFGASSASTSDA